MANPLLSLGFVLSGLAGRALTDKLLVVKGGAVAVAAWAQISSVAELVSGVSLSGMGIALTALAAGQSPGERLAWLRPALTLGLGLSLLAALAAAWLLPWKALFPGGAGIAPAALLAGWLAVAPGMLSAWLIGAGRMGAAIFLLLLGLAAPVVMLLAAPFSDPLADMLSGQIAFGLVALAGTLLAVRRQPPPGRETLAALWRFVPAGLAIGILSPLSSAWARGEIAASLSWEAAGQVQALWRSTDWITAMMSGVLSTYFLPRLGMRHARPAFLRELRRAALATVPLAVALLVLLWLFLPRALSALYRPEMIVARGDALWFLLGDATRVVSWVFLFGLFARHRAWAITAGEFLSLPLFALLLALVPGHHGLQQVGVLWFASYAAYALFNASALWWALRRSRP